ncbi:hypothetical protein ID046_002246 [Salmonella enterica]|nr:hypothetical protein [Salmonella enterica]
MVVLGAVHPVVGLLFMEVIPDSEVGYVDIYQLTDSLLVGDYLVINNPAWRQREPTFDGKAWDEWVISEHLSRIDWYSNEAIQRICREHNLSCSDLHRWAEDVTRWVNVPVMVDRDSNDVTVTLL